MTCRFCGAKHKSKKPFENHERFCKVSIEQGKAHKVRFKHFQCFCNRCTNGNSEDCKYRQHSGDEKIAWLISASDTCAITEKMMEDENDEMREKHQSTIAEALAIYEKKHSAEQNNLKFDGLKKNHLVALTKACSLEVTRLDGKAGQVRISDFKTALENCGGWKSILDAVNK